jgi:hypothetical protein
MTPFIITDIFVALSIFMQTFYKTKFMSIGGVRQRRIINSYIRPLCHPWSPSRLIFLDCWTLKRRSVFVSLYRVMSKKAKIFRSTSLSVCFKYCRVWHFQFWGSSVYSTMCLRSDKTDTTAFAAPEDWYLFSVSCVAALKFRNVFAIMKVSTYAIHGNNSLAWSCRERKYGRCC